MNFNERFFKLKILKQLGQLTISLKNRRHHSLEHQIVGGNGP